MKFLVACKNANGEPDMFAVETEVDDDQVNSGEHYDIVSSIAWDEGYEGPFIVYDEHEIPNVVNGLNALEDLAAQDDQGTSPS